MWSAVPLRSYQCYFSFDLKSWYAVSGTVTAGPSDTSLSIFDWGSTLLRGCYYKVEILPWKAGGSPAGKRLSIETTTASGCESTTWIRSDTTSTGKFYRIDIE